MDRERGSLCPAARQPRVGLPLGDRPTPIIPGRQRRRRGGRRRGVPATPFTAAVALCLLGCSLAAAVITAPPATAGPHGRAPVQAAASSTAAVVGTSAPLTLAAQSGSVAPGQNFDVRVQPGRGTPAVGGLGLTVAVYGCLSSVSAFDQSVNTSSGPSGTRITATRSPLPLASLPVVDGAYDLSMPVAPGTGGPTPAGGFAIDLAGGGAQCGAYPYGVYPVRIDLVDTTSGQVLGGFTTHLVYANPPAGTQRLQVALVLPVHTTQRAAVAPSPAALRTRPSLALAPPPAGDIDAATATVSAIATTHPQVPVTLEASPQTLQLLDSTGHQATVAQLASLATTPRHQVAASPYVPVDAAALVGAGLQTELDLQVAQGVQVLDGTVTHIPPGSFGAWFSDASLDAATLAQLQTAGYDRVVLPSSSLSSVPTNGSTAEPFTLTSSRGAAMTALAYNADLTARFPGSASDPVLAAHQLAAELAQMYYEKPNDTTVRGVVVVAPGGWPDNPVFVDTLLGALQSSPLLEPVTTTNLFAALGPPSPCRTCRSTTPNETGLPAGAVRTQRQRINGLVTAAPAARQLGTQLSEVLLSGQSDDLRPNQQAAVVANASAAVDAQLAQLAVAGDRTVTLTSHTGRVPVTVVSAAPYPVIASMTLTSDKLLFANHSTSITEGVDLAPARSNVFPVSVQARASGQFKVDIVLRVPGSAMVLSSGQVSVRSTATSVVGILLSLGAVAVLAAWWIRTSRKRRRARRAASARDAEPAEPVVTGRAGG